MYNILMWEVILNKKVCKDREKLPSLVKYKLDLLLKELKVDGPYRNNWKNYGQLKGNSPTYHCHIKKGNPTYVVIWNIVNKKIKIMEVKYVGTHEKTPY